MSQDYRDEVTAIGKRSVKISLAADLAEMVDPTGG